MSLEVFYSTASLPQCDLYGIVEVEQKLCGIINNCPLRRRAVPFLTIDLFRDNDRRLRFFARDADLNIVDLTGATCIFSVKESKSATSFVLQKSTANAGEGMIGSADEGEAFFFIEPTDTVALDAGQYVYDVQVILSDGKQYTSVEGYLNLKLPVN
jgi:hypothetical protein